ncbi:MAG: adenosylcobinamide-phosphate synthase CbiB [Opitutaceae bacterium]|jgi:adenosylcobinamide-phosphate synthase|nr:adenosylcobinamide-phosphate synthase CbiB [Opitutaceae bacterium]
MHLTALQSISLAALFLGAALDLALGDPRRLPHPIVGYGRTIALGERLLNHGPPRARFLKGAVLALALVAATGALWAAGLALAARIHACAAAALAAFGVFTALAHRTLITECRAVFRALGDGSRDSEPAALDAARRRLARIVGRDTARLDARQIRIAALETLAENLSDGVVAPLFWYALGGVPAMMACKMANTLDSMIGHHDDRHEFFGKTAARLDDAVNYLPARLTALLLALAAHSPRALRFVARYGRAHASPNAGYPEAALAGALDLRFGGPNHYDGELVEKPFIGRNPRAVRPDEIDTAARHAHITLALMLLLTAAARLLLPLPFP